MKLLQLPPGELRRQLAGSGIWLRTGPFSLRVRSRIDSVAEGLGELYGQFEVRNPQETFADFHVSVDPQMNLRRGLRPKVNFSFDGIEPFEPEPLDQAYPMLERGLDWCVSEHAHQYLMIHAAVVEKNDQTVILPAPPDSGKSTLVAALVLSGWRLLSDEQALIDRKTGWIHPLPRPIHLRNESISLIRAFSADAYISRPSRDTTKGSIAYLRPPKESVRRQHEPAQPGWIIFPKWLAESEPELLPHSKQQSFRFLTQFAINYTQLSAEAFRACTGLIQQADCYDFQYSRLDQAVDAFDQLAALSVTNKAGN